MSRFLAVALLLAGCGAADPPEKLCKLAAKCANQQAQEFTNEDIDACIAEYEESQRFYDGAGCGQEYAAFMSCAAENAACDGNGEVMGIYDTCAPELDASVDCVDPDTLDTEV